MGKEASDSKAKSKQPPRPKSLRLYSFGSPRVGNTAFADLFDSFLAEGYIDEAYRIVNGQDVVARLPRSANVLVADINYEHCGPTALVTQPTSNDLSVDSEKYDNVASRLQIWVEGTY